MNALQLRWLREQGPEFALEWVNKMENELLDEVYLNTPTVYDYSLPIPYRDYEYLPYTIEDFMEVAPKGVIHYSLDSMAFSKNK